MIDYLLDSLLVYFRCEAANKIRSSMFLVRRGLLVLAYTHSRIRIFLREKEWNAIPHVFGRPLLSNKYTTSKYVLFA